MVVRRSTKEIGPVKSDFRIETETAVQAKDSAKADEIKTLRENDSISLIAKNHPIKDRGNAEIKSAPTAKTNVRAKDSAKIDASEKTSIFCIIAGSYPINDRKNAEMEMRKYAAKGLKSEIIETPTRLRICVGKFPSETEALKEIPEYCKTTGRKDLWVLKFLK